MNGICNLSISHKWASLNDLECARIDNVEDALKAMHAAADVSECVIVQTCNRIELYLNVTNEFDVSSFIGRFFPAVPQELIGRYESRESLRHLMRLASGLDSMIVGEDQILGQLKAGGRNGEQRGHIRARLGLSIIPRRLKLGKRVRTETQINRGSVSVGSAAVDLAERVMGSLEDKAILSIGAGELGTLVAVALAERELKAMFVSNRTFRRAQTLAKRLGGICDSDLTR